MLLLQAALALDTTDITLRGVCDGSTAVRLPNGRLLVAYDEDRSLHGFAVAGGDRLERLLEPCADLGGQRLMTGDGGGRIVEGGRVRVGSAVGVLRGLRHGTGVDGAGSRPGGGMGLRRNQHGRTGQQAGHGQRDDGEVNVYEPRLRPRHQYFL